MRGACVQEQQAREQAMAARMQEEAEANMTEMDKARDMLKMKTVKIRQASAEVGLNSPSPSCFLFPHLPYKIGLWISCTSNARKKAVQLFSCAAFADLIDAASIQASRFLPCKQLCLTA